MKFDELDKKMRVFETAHDYCVVPEMYMIARIDGRGFTRLTKEKYPFQIPFDETFRDYMAETVRHLMTASGFNVIYGYTQSDEISLLFDKNETLFGRKMRKINSILAGETSAKFSVMLGSPAAFDCRISEIPNQDLVVDYFRWRNEDAHRNALNAYCYWNLRKAGKSKAEATIFLNGQSVAFKNEYLFTNQINFNELPQWQKRGIGFFWEEYEKESGEGNDTCIRRRLCQEMQLPMKDDYSSFVRKIIEGNG